MSRPRGVTVAWHTRWRWPCDSHRDRGQQQVSLAMILRTELTHTRAAFRSGRIDAFKATLVARETGCLSAEDRALVDEQLVR